MGESPTWGWWKQVEILNSNLAINLIFLFYIILLNINDNIYRNKDQCTAGVSTLLLEFSLLSYLTNKTVFHDKAHDTLMRLWTMKSKKTGLFGKIKILFLIIVKKWWKVYLIPIYHLWLELFSVYH